MAKSLTIPNKKGKVRDANPLPVKLRDDDGDAVDSTNPMPVGIYLISDDVSQIMAGFTDNIDGKKGAEHKHTKIHKKDHYFICGYQSFTNAQVVDFTVVVPDVAKLPHMTFSILGSGATRLEIYRPVVVSSTGTPVTAFNNDDNSEKTSNLTIRIGDTFTDIGTLWFANQAGANKESGVISRSRELILKRDTTYLFRITNATTLANVITWCAEWYEHTPKN